MQVSACMSAVYFTSFSNHNMSGINAAGVLVGEAGKVLGSGRELLQGLQGLLQGQRYRFVSPTIMLSFSVDMYFSIQCKVDIFLYYGLVRIG